MKEESEASATTQEPTSATLATPQLPMIKRKNHFWTFVLAGFLLFVAGGAGSIYGYIAFFGKQPTTQTNTLPLVTEPVTMDVTASSVVNDIKPLLKNPLITIKQHDYNGATDQDNRAAYSAPFYKPTGYEFETNPKTYAGVASQGQQSTAEADLVAIKSYLDSKGFKHANIDTTSLPYVIYTDTYYTDAVRCTVEESHYLTPYLTGIGCADTSSYDETAKAIQPLYVVSKAAGNAYLNFFMLEEMKPSKTPGYTIATVEAGDENTGAALLFYQTPDKVWHYFITTQQVVGCSNYNTTDIKKAFLGETCANPDATVTTVKL